MSNRFLCLALLSFLSACSDSETGTATGNGSDAGTGGRGTGGTATGGGAGTGGSRTGGASGGGTSGSGGVSGSGGTSGSGGGGGASNDGGPEAGDAGGGDAGTGDADSGPFIPQVGPSIPHLGEPDCPIDLAITSTGVPYAMYVDTPTRKFAVARFDGTAWVPLAAPPMAGSLLNGHCYSITLENDTTPVIAFHERLAGNVDQKQVQRWNGSAFVPLGSVFASDFYSSAVDLVTDGQGRVIFVTTNGMDIVVRRWNEAGSTWDALGAPFHRVEALVGEAYITLGSGDQPIIAFLEGTGGSNAATVYVSSFDGNTWNAVGGALDSIPNATQFITVPSIAFDGQPVVTYMKKPPIHIGVFKWSGTAWVDESFTDQATQDPQSRPVVYARGGTKVLAWGEDGQLAVRRFSGSTWDPKITTLHGASVMKVAKPVLAEGGGKLFMSHQGASNDGFVVRIP